MREIIINEKMSWIKVTAFAVLCGVGTGIIMLIPALEHTAIHNIGVCFEAWILLALIVILGCAKPLEAGLKTFVFFLISQPLVYLVQVPFASMGWDLFGYYRFWFILTLLTFPGGMIAWLVKKKSWLSAAVLAVAIVMLAFEFAEHLKSFVKEPPYQVLALLFIILLMIAMILLIFDEKRKRVALLAFSAAAVLVMIMAATSLIIAHTNEYAVVFMDGSYHIVSCDEEIEASAEEGCITVRTSAVGDFDVIVENDSGVKKNIRFHCQNDMISETIYTFDEDGNLVEE